MDALVATTDEGYVELAVGLVRDGTRLMTLRKDMIARRDVLFGDEEPVIALERFLESVARPAAAGAAAR